MNEITHYLENISKKTDLTKEEAARAMQIISWGGATPAQISAFIMGLATKGETKEEILGVVEILQYKLKKSVDISNLNNYLLISNTNFDFNSIRLFAISIIIASLDCKIISFLENTKDSNIHDFLSELGFNYEYNLELLEKSFVKNNLSIIIPSLYNFLTKDVISITEEISIRNIFDVAKPLLYRFNNEISHIIKLSSQEQLDIYTDIFKELNRPLSKHASEEEFRGNLAHRTGMYSNVHEDSSSKLTYKLSSNAEFPKRSNTDKVWLLHNQDKENLFSTKEMNYLTIIEKGNIIKEELDLKDFLDDNNQDVNNQYKEFELDQFLKFFNGENIYQRKSIILDAAMCLVMVGKADNIQDALSLVIEALDSGKAKAVIKNLVEIAIVI